MDALEGTARPESLSAALGSVMAAATGVDEVDDLIRLTGGASRETYRFRCGARRYVLQRERPGTQRRLQGMAAEAQVIDAAAAAGVAVPTVVVSNHDAPDTALGPSFFVAEAVDGETIARRILRDDQFAVARHRLARQFGEALAAVHRIDPAPMPWLERDDELAKYRRIADEVELARPAFEIAFRWLEQNRPTAGASSVVHGDFRLGNMIVDSAGLAAVIDWELAHVSDPMEDLAWLCVRAWRFGARPPVAGVGTYAELLGGYEAITGVAVDRAALRWWEVMGTLKWGIMCGLQANAHLSGAYRSVELAAIGRRIVEQEQDVLSLIEQTERAGVS